MGRKARLVRTASGWRIEGDGFLVWAEDMLEARAWVADLAGDALGEAEEESP